MNDAPQCPSPDLLRRLSLGQLAEAEVSALYQHLVRCAACTQVLETFHQPTTTLPRPNGGTASVDTPTQDLPTVPLQRFDFLAPPQQKGELGRLGHYRIVKLLGEGGMGMVFQAEDVLLERPVALKVMKPEVAANETARQRFLQEGKLAAALQHDYVVTIYQVGEDRGVPFLAMQFLQGESLDDRLKREGRLPVAEILRIGREAAEGLAAAHERGLIHRDIKPANIWLERVDVARPARVKILDFGLARNVGDQSSHLTRTGIVMGTPDYMAPEQARSQSLDPRCDLFSLGCVLYRMCTGRKPFQGDDVMATLLAVTTDEPPPARNLNPEVPWELEERIRRLMAKHPDDRPKTARVVVDELAVLERRMQEALAVAQTPTVGEEKDIASLQPPWLSPAPGGSGRTYEPASRRKLRKSLPSPQPEEPPAPSNPVVAPQREQVLPRQESDPPLPSQLKQYGLSSWEGEKTDKIPSPTSLANQASTSHPVALSAANTAGSPTLRTPPSAVPAPLFPPPPPPVVASQTTACPRCGSQRFSSSGQKWCLSCGYYPGMPDENLGKGRPAEKSGWGWTLLAGIVCVLLLTAAGHFYLPSNTPLWKRWVLVQMGGGLAAIVIAYLWAYVIVWPYYDDSRTFAHLWSSPIRFSSLVLQMFPKTKKTISLAIWGLTATLAALYVVGDITELWRGKRMQLAAPIQLETFGLKIAEKDREKRETMRCVVIGYFVEGGSIGNVALAIRDGGKLRYVGSTDRVQEFTNSEGIGQQLITLKCGKPQADVPNGLNATWVNPKLGCTVSYTKRDENGILSNPIIERWER